ncbi:hypothetical protein HDV62DRAFT_149820 [Trichoderma sp. SZMC 28011]
MSRIYIDPTTIAVVAKDSCPCAARLCSCRGPKVSPSPLFPFTSRSSFKHVLNSTRLPESAPSVASRNPIEAVEEKLPDSHEDQGSDRKPTTKPLEYVNSVDAQ